ncbi:hypothetical protein HOA64_03620 [bacterium]|nr:hypothetical protein [bacterium]
MKFTVGSVSPLTSGACVAQFYSVAEAMCELGFRVFVLAEGDSNAQRCCFDLLEKYPENFEILESVPASRTKILNESDVVFFPAQPDKKMFQEIISQKIVPVLPEECGVVNFDAQRETGEGFTFESGKIWSMVAALIRASENKKFSYDWKNIQKNIENLKV